MSGLTRLTIWIQPMGVLKMLTKVDCLFVRVSTWMNASIESLTYMEANVKGKEKTLQRR